jgi:iron(III) transport system permease protein
MPGVTRLTSARVLRTALQAVALLVLVGPAAALVAALARAGVAGGSDLVAAAALSGRRLALLGQSVLLGAAVATAAMTVGVLAGIALWRRGSRPAWVRSLLPVAIVVPPSLHALTWTTTLHGLLPMSLRPALLAGVAADWVACWAVEVLAFLPLATWIALVGLEGVPEPLLEAARVARAEAAVLGRVALPLAAPTLGAGAALLFALSLSDHGVPALFALSVSALDVLAQFSADREPATALLTALPLVAIQAAAVAVLLAPLRAAAVSARPTARRSRPSPLPGGLATAQGLALALLAAQLLVPLLSLAWQTGSPQRAITTTSDAAPEVATSLALAAAAAVAGPLLGWVVSGSLAAGRPAGRWWWLAVGLPFALPAPLTGIGVALLGNVIPALGAGLAPALLAALSRVVPVVALLLYAGRLRTSSELLDAARVFQRDPLHGLVRVRAPLLGPWLAAAATLAFALTLGELGATLIVAAPGRATVTMRLFNLLHYGATPAVAALCLLLELLVLLVATAGLLLPQVALDLRRRQRETPTEGR